MPPMPLGIAYLAAHLNPERHECKVLDLMFEARPLEKVKEAITQFQPDVVGISVRNIDNQRFASPHFFMDEAREVVETCRSMTSAKIVIGGGAVTAFPSEAMKHLGADIGIIGEGELVFSQLVDLLEEGESYSSLPGIAYREDGRIRVKQLHLNPDLDALSPPRRDLIDNKRYLKEGGLGNIVVKLGCLFRCIYCDAPYCMGKRLRIRSPEHVVRELESMKDMGIEGIFFTDAVFNRPVEHAMALCQAIERRGLKIRWCATFNPAFANRDLIKAMKRAGCTTVELSSDTCSEEMLSRLKKGFTKAQMLSACKALEEEGIDYIIFLLLGGPGESEKTFEESVVFLEGVKPLCVNFTPGIRVMPHTPLATMARKQGLIPRGKSLFRPTFYVEPEVQDWLLERIQEVTRDRKNWLTEIKVSKG